MHGYIENDQWKLHYKGIKQLDKLKESGNKTLAP